MSVFRLCGASRRLPLHLATLALLAFAVGSASGCKNRRKPSQLNVLTVDVSSVHVRSDDATIAAGRKIFLQHCLQCHLPDGSGGVGANLTDDTWVLGGDTATIIRVIAAGTTNGMPGWGGMLSTDQLSAVTSYVFSINPHLNAGISATSDENEDTFLP